MEWKNGRLFQWMITRGDLNQRTAYIRHHQCKQMLLVNLRRTHTLVKIPDSVFECPASLRSHTRIWCREHIYSTLYCHLLCSMVAHKRYDQDYALLMKFSTYVKQRLRVSLAELLFVASFALNFFLGKVLHLYSEQAEVYNYYNDKGNIFNQLFVKKGWAWTTIAVVYFYGNVLLRQHVKNVQNTLLLAFVRYAAATFWWYLFTQWCFGLPIMDKLFVYTGGKCVATDGKHLSHLFEELDGLFHSNKISSYACRKIKGSWEGGHDPLGHVFLMVHSSLYLFFEIMPYWRGWQQLKRDWQGLKSQTISGKVVQTFYTTPQVVVMLLMALWWFMLLMTNMYFHLIAEKLAGLWFGYIGIAAIYYIPRWF